MLTEAMESVASRGATQSWAGAGEEILGAEELIVRLERAVRLGNAAATTARIQADLEHLLGQGLLSLPEGLCRPNVERYARRLLHRDPDLDYTAIVMTWGPGQRTPLHDHDGAWCVEGVVEGEIEVTQYELMDGPVGESGDLFHFERRGTQWASPGEAGALIPPLEHHVLGNAHEDRVAVTLHVYQGEMAQCSVFEPVRAKETGNETGNGAANGHGSLFRRRVKALGYDD